MSPLSRTLLLCGVFLAGGCAAPAVVAIKPGYNFSKVGRVALVGLQDPHGQPGIGDAVARELEPYLLRAGYDLIERGQVDKLLKEQAFGQSGSVDPKTAAELGKILGVDAVVLGQVVSAVQPRSETFIQNVTETTYRPVYRTVAVKDRKGVARAREVLDHYDVATSNDQIPHTYTSGASIGFSARLVEVSTGQVLWTGTIESDGPSIRDAASTACERLVDALKAAWPAAKRG